MPGTVKVQQNALQDNSKNPALIAHSGTAGTALTRRITSSGTPGALDVMVVGTSVTIGGGSNVNIVTGTQQTLGTVGVLNTGSVVVTTGTIGNINKIGTVGVVDTGSIVQTAGTVTTGSLSNLATIGTIQNLVSGTIVQASGTLTTGSIDILPLSGLVLTTAVTIGTVGTAAIPSTVLTNRKALIGFNTGTVTVYLGGTGVTTTSGIPIGTNAFTPSIDLGTGILYGIAGTTGGTIIAMEIS